MVVKLRKKMGNTHTGRPLKPCLKHGPITVVTLKEKEKKQIQFTRIEDKIILSGVVVGFDLEWVWYGLEGIW